MSDQGNEQASSGYHHTARQAIWEYLPYNFHWLFFSVSSDTVLLEPNDVNLSMECSDAMVIEAPLLSSSILVLITLSAEITRQTVTLSLWKGISWRSREVVADH